MNEQINALERAVERLNDAWINDRTSHHDADVAILRQLAADLKSGAHLSEKPNDN